MPTAELPESKDEVASSNATFLGLRFAGELGYMIAVPAVLFGFGGAYLDKYIHTTPLFIILGLVVAFALSAIGVTRKVKEIVEATPDPKRKKEPLPPLK
jgi:F0F1-type ATP synthase assembly protein I